MRFLYYGRDVRVLPVTRTLVTEKRLGDLQTKRPPPPVLRVREHM